MIDFESFSLFLPNAESTRALGDAIAHSVSHKTVIALIGPLGAGKTALVQSIAEGLGVTDSVQSPTFTMMNEYHSGRLPLYHLDLYRISEDGAAMLDSLLLELDDLLNRDAVVLIEWADLLENFSSSTNMLNQLDHLVARLSYGEEVKASKAHPKNSPSFYIENGRNLELTAHGELSNQLLLGLKSCHRAFINNA